MNFLKEIKGKAIAAVLEKKKQCKEELAAPQAAQTKPKVKRTDSFFADIKNKALASTIFQLAAQKMEGPKKQQQEDISIQNLKTKGGKIWKTVKTTEASEGSKEHQTEEEQEIDLESCTDFIVNLTIATRNREKEERLRVNKAKAEIMSAIEAEPIYMEPNTETRILKMELEAYPVNQLCIRTQSLVEDQLSVDHAIQRVILSGYLYKANDLKQKNLIEGCQQVIESNEQKVSNLCTMVRLYRKNIEPLLHHYKKMETLKNKQQILLKKIALLKKLKGYRKDLNLKIENIDQAFFVERNKQKMYNHLVRKDETVKKVAIFKKFKDRILTANKNTIKLMDKSLKSWIDQGVLIENKEIEKTLILLYFVRNEPMYQESHLEYRFDGIKQKEKLCEQLKNIKKWPDYKYVNDRGVKEKVRQFLRGLIRELTPADKDRSEKLLVTLKGG